jgi:microcin C transport system ATP-binding protein
MSDKYTEDAGGLRSAQEQGTALLRVENLSVSYVAGSVQREVLRGVSFAIHAGERLALVGESGSGKSVTALSVLRLLDSQRAVYRSGSIHFEGRDLLRVPPAELRRIRGRDIAMVFQEPMTSLNPVLTIGQQLVEPLQVHEGLSAAKAKMRVIELLQRTGIAEPQRRFDAYPHMLSGGQRQRVMIAMALACRPRLLLADEPTTALDVTVQLQILTLLEELQREFAMAVLLISHDLNLVRRFADRICVMRAGEIVEQAPTAELFASPKHAYTQQLLASEPRRCALSPPTGGAAPLLQARHVECRFVLRGRGWRGRSLTVHAVDQVSVSVRPGETVGIVGESGSGKSTLGMCLLRLQACAGDIRFAGHVLNALPARDLRRLRRDFQVVFQDPYSSLHPRRTVEQIVGEGLLIHHPELARRDRHQRVTRVLEEVGLAADMLPRYPHEFSGGQRQRIAIARAVILQPKLVLLDEPTSALDATVQTQVLALLRELQERRGMSYLFISHDLKVIRAVAHRTLVMRGGQVVEEGETEALFQAPQHDYTRQLLAAALFAAG